MLTTFSFGVSSNLSQRKSATAEIWSILFYGTIIPRKYMPIIFAVGLFFCDKFEETPNENVINMSKFKKSYFNQLSTFFYPPPPHGYVCNRSITHKYIELRRKK